MFYSISGKLLNKSLEEAVVEAGGIGFRIAVPASVFYSLPSIGEDVFLYTHFVVKEDAFELYGFSTLNQCEFFKTLIKVSGVGPKIGIAILSTMTPESVAQAISSGSHRPFTAVPGVGPKLAQRIVLELKDKIGKLDIAVSSESSAPVIETASSDDDAYEALLALGFTRAEATRALSKVSGSLPTDQKITAALRELSNGR